MTERPTDAYEAERTCLGAAMIDNRALEGLSELLRVEHFAEDMHRRIYAAMLALRDRSEAVDPVTLRQEIGAAEAGSYVAGLLDGVPRLSNVDQWARIVREAARLRALVALGAHIAGWVDRCDGEASLVVDRAQQALQRIHEDGNDRSFVTSMPEALKGAYAEIDRMANSGHGVTGIASGLADLDSVLEGFQPGTVYTIGARTGRGKSALASQFAMHASGNGSRVLMFTLEMPPEQVAKRMLMSHARVSKWDLLQHDESAWSELGKSFGALSTHTLEFDRHEAPTLAHMRTHCAQMKRSGGLDMVVIDYFQRCATTGKGERWQMLGELARGIKSLAQAFAVPVIMPAQLNRTAEDQRPTLAHLRESGDLESESDVVLLLHPTPMPGKTPEEIMKLEFPAVDLIVAKNRHGEGRVVPLSFEKHYVRFVSAAPKREYAEVEQPAWGQ